MFSTPRMLTSEAALCLGYCTKDDITDHMMATAQAVLLGYQEATGRPMDGFEGMFDIDAPGEDDDEPMPTGSSDSADDTIEDNYREEL